MAGTTTARIDMKDVYLYVFTRQTNESEVTYHGFKFSQGDFNYSVKDGFEFITDRGLLATGSVRSTDEVPCEVRFEGEYQTVYADDLTYTPYEIIKGRGKCKGWRGLGTNSCEPYASWLVLLNDPLIRLPNCAAGEGLIFRDFFCETADFATKAGTCSFNGKCRVVEPEKIAADEDGSFTSADITCTVDGETATVQLNFPPIHTHA